MVCITLWQPVVQPQRRRLAAQQAGVLLSLRSVRHVSDVQCATSGYEARYGVRSNTLSAMWSARGQSTRLSACVECQGNTHVGAATGLKGADKKTTGQP